MNVIYGHKRTAFTAPYFTAVTNLEQKYVQSVIQHYTAITETSVDRNVFTCTNNAWLSFRRISEHSEPLNTLWWTARLPSKTDEKYSTYCKSFIHAVKKIMAFPEAIFTKHPNPQTIFLEISRAKFQSKLSTNMERTGRNPFTPIRNVWL